MTNRNFQFGWVGTPSLANSIAMEALPIPSVIILNSTSFQHHIPDDAPEYLTPEAVEMFLESVSMGTARVSLIKFFLNVIAKIIF